MKALRYLLSWLCVYPRNTRERRKPSLLALHMAELNSSPIRRNNRQ